MNKDRNTSDNTTGTDNNVDDSTRGGTAYNFGLENEQIIVLSNHYKPWIHLFHLKQSESGQNVIEEKDIFRDPYYKLTNAENIGKYYNAQEKYLEHCMNRQYRILCYIHDRFMDPYRRDKLISIRKKYGLSLERSIKVFDEYADKQQNFPIDVCLQKNQAFGEDVQRLIEETDLFNKKSTHLHEFYLTAAYILFGSMLIEVKNELLDYISATLTAIMKRDEGTIDGDFNERLLMKYGKKLYNELLIFYEKYKSHVRAIIDDIYDLAYMPPKFIVCMVPRINVIHKYNLDGNVQRYIEFIPYYTSKFFRYFVNVINEGLAKVKTYKPESTEILMGRDILGDVDSEIVGDFKGKLFFELSDKKLPSNIRQMYSWKLAEKIIELNKEFIDPNNKPIKEESVILLLQGLGLQYEGQYTTISDDDKIYKLHALKNENDEDLRYDEYEVSIGGQRFILSPVNDVNEAKCLAENTKKYFSEGVWNSRKHLVNEIPPMDSKLDLKYEESLIDKAFFGKSELQKYSIELTPTYTCDIIREMECEGKKDHDFKMRKYQQISKIKVRNAGKKRESRKKN